MNSVLRLWLGSLFFGLLALSCARAQMVTISFGAGTLYNFNGATLPTGSLVLLIADTSQNGFGSLLAGSTLNAGDFLNADDEILGRAFTDSNSTAAATFALIPLTTTLTSGDPLALVWFSAVDGSSTVLASGDQYGLFSSASLTDGSPWVVPSAGSTIAINFTTINDLGAHAETEAYATLTVIPEPATYASLFGAAALGFVAYRRRHRA